MNGRKEQRERESKRTKESWVERKWLPMTFSSIPVSSKKYSILFRADLNYVKCQLTALLTVFYYV